MLQYLNIILDDSSVSYCHYEPGKERRLIALGDLKQGIRFAMIENLMVQLIWPDYDLPPAYLKVIDSIDHFNIRPTADDADVCVVDGWNFETASADVPIVVRTSMQQLFVHEEQLMKVLSQVQRLNVVITDIHTLKNADVIHYRQFLAKMVDGLTALYAEELPPQLNIITDRMQLTGMNNCEAAVNNITLAPNGKFYVCPAFYFENEADCVGDLEYGLDIKNKQLYKLEYAPICRHCDAWQCKRCIWLNRKTTLEVNTPSHEQCVVAHLERNASRELLQNIRKHGTFLPEQEEIKEIDYLDPFDKRDEWQ